MSSRDLKVDNKFTAKITVIPLKGQSQNRNVKLFFSIIIL